MSYCRTGDDSNVYVFGTGTGRDGPFWIEIYVQVSEQVDKTIKLDPENFEDYWKNWRDLPHELGGNHYRCNTEQEALDKLLWLREQGLLVPERALIRLRHEIAGTDWITCKDWINAQEQDL